ncbi:MAG: hypothetical protein K0R29_595 [Pseudobdellovibrio sp.]|jgi:uncharacterized iron-regulated protein|nr:hypothetical protein [Pseudobdellovibrio sp.]
MKKELKLTKPLSLIVAFFISTALFSCSQSPKVSSSDSSVETNAENLSPVPAVLKTIPVILVGETHYYTPFGAYEYLLNKVVAEENTCIGVEIPYEAGDFSLSLKKLRARSAVVKSNEDKERISRVAETYSKLAELARAKNFKVIGIDDKNHYVSELNVEQRNKAMAENMARLLKSKTCSRIIAILGKAHLTMGSQRASTVKLLLGQAGIESLAVNLQITTEAGMPEEYQSFEASGLQGPIEFEWVLNKSLPKMVRVLPNIKNDVSVWQEFDWTLLIPIIFRAEKF